MFAKLPAPPYYTVIFSSELSLNDTGYELMAKHMVELAAQQIGFLGIESARDSAGFGITVSYWANEEAIKNWHKNVEHLAAQKLGQRDWYQHYEIRVAKVERAYGKQSSGAG